MPRPSIAPNGALAPAPLTRFHQRLLAEEVGVRGGAGTERAARALSAARVDLNPHQVEAAAFALDALAQGGCLLADEVGLGKTIEAGLVLSQLVAEGKTRLLILTPATLRAQWQAELASKFELDATIIDGRSARKAGNPFDQPLPVIASIPFAGGRAEQLAGIKWDLVVIDEAHRLRNAHRAGNKLGKALRTALAGRPKVLLTATPLQNDLSELFGLVSMLDERVLGPVETFSAHHPVDSDGAMPDGALSDLKMRLSPVVHRTLRRQVREYVRFTNRRSIVEDFSPSPEEQSLYEDVSEFLRRSEALALEPGKKTLLTLVYRKLLASSTHAIAPTLQRLAETLEKKLRTAQIAESLLAGEDAATFAEEAEGWEDDPAAAPARAKLEGELVELKAYAARAASIKVNARGEALKRALDRVFTVARAHQWPEKAVIFTESRRTQDYLFDLLTSAGWHGRIVRLNGDAATPEARAALVREFTERASILISTEAGAEGLNLQFCNLVVNYDLPWNPQRLEQRIGRCHRYGQERDVLVLNFLNRQNAADERLYALLEKKLNLFDGVFGASDEVLGALESGIDFEKRVLDIYQSCRGTKEIQAAFDQLQKELETRIDQRMTETRALLFERFDGDVRRRMELALGEAKATLEARNRSARALTGAVLGAPAKSRAQVAAAAAQVKGRPAEVAHYLKLDGASLIGDLAGLRGKEGWWFVWKFEVTGPFTEDRLLHVLLVREEETFRAVRVDGAALARVPAAEEPLKRPAPLSVADAHEAALERVRDDLVRSCERRAAKALDHAKETIDRAAEDAVWPVRQKAEEARGLWEKARRAVANEEEPTLLMKARAERDRAERAWKKAQAAVRTAEEQQAAAAERDFAALQKASKPVLNRTLIASAWFWAE